MNVADAAYLQAAAARLDLPIPDEFAAEILAAFEVITAQARLLEAFELPDGVEAAPRFVP